MQQSGYDNTRYWRGIHEQLGDQLRAVGHPWLSNSLNILKYESEAHTVLEALRALPISFPANPSVLDIGAGTGYWTTVVGEWLRAGKREPRQAALDLSRPALELIAARHPGIEAIEADLKTVSPGHCESRFDLVMAMYCLHHIVDAGGFDNALRFAARSVRTGGCLLLMDPILTDAYSPFYGVDWKTWPGNGLPRPLAAVDAAFEEEGLKRLLFTPAVSFVLNGPIEAASRWKFSLAQRTWDFLGHLYCREWATKAVSGTVRAIDNTLKKSGKALSSSLCLYHRP